MSERTAGDVRRSPDHEDKLVRESVRVLTRMYLSEPEDVGRAFARYLTREVGPDVAREFLDGFLLNFHTEAKS